MKRLLLALLVAALPSQAAAQLRADIRKDTPPGQATMRVYDGGKLLFQATTQGLNAVTESKFSTDGRWLLNIADGQGYVQLWDVEKGERVRTFLAPFARIVAADFTPDSEHFLLNFRGEPGGQPSESFAASFWRVAPLRREGALEVARSYGPNGQYALREGGYDGHVHFSRDGRRMVFAPFGSYGVGAASVFDARTGRRVSVISRLPYPKGAPQVGGAGARAARLSPDGGRVLVLYVDGRLAEYDADTASLLRLRGKPAEAQARAQLDTFARTGK
ncbi:hypothetical protein RDMS_11580 [Deinococcus sp. RL]|uniref:WD40 repeat domain-containing protein n=1 Tax=Deinococcus sp. RL TaxID=1489678 RepID=UPI0004D7A02F|nr:WD40 repeat domain-containing protein [Deinococcus sp. RL]KEF33613.1 hypothetical protein RDMS_11580 [Deinococcus sp. RL]